MDQLQVIPRPDHNVCCPGHNSNTSPPPPTPTLSLTILAVLSPWSPSLGVCVFESPASLDGSMMTCKPQQLIGLLTDQSESQTYSTFHIIGRLIHALEKGRPRNSTSLYEIILYRLKFPTAEGYTERSRS